MLFFIYFYYSTNKHLEAYRGKKLLIIGAIFFSKTIGLNPTLFNIINPIETIIQPITKKINLLIIPTFLFSVLKKSFKIINNINENKQIENISLNKFN